MNQTEMHTYATREYCKRVLFEIDQVLAGRGDGCLFKLSADDYAQAREAVVTLCSVVQGAELVPSGIGRAKGDAAFQQFLGAALTRPRGRQRKGREA